MSATEPYRRHALDHRAQVRGLVAPWHLLWLILAGIVAPSHGQAQRNEQDLAPATVAQARVPASGLARVRSAASSAAAPSQVTESDIEQARRSARQPSQAEIDAARRKYEQVVTPLAPLPPGHHAPALDNLPAPAGRIDLEALARGFAALPETSLAQGLTQQPGLLIFISLTMPRPTLERLSQQAAQAQATLVLRGLAGGSLRQTVAQLQPFLKGRQVSVQIDPVAFDRFAITRVPAFVLVRDGARPQSCASGTCTAPEHFLSVSGDVSLDYALQHMHSAAPTFRRDAAGFIARLRGGPGGKR